MFVKDIHKEKALSKKTAPLRKCINMVVWVVGTAIQLLIKDSYTETKCSKYNVVTGKTPFFVIGSFCSSHLFVLSLASDSAVLFRNEILVLSIKKRYSSFLKKSFCFSEKLLQRLMC